MDAKYGINNIGTYQEEVGEEIYLEVDDGIIYTSTCTTCHLWVIRQEIKLRIRNLRLAYIASRSRYWV